MSPASPLCRVVPLRAASPRRTLLTLGLSSQLRDVFSSLPNSPFIDRGIPFACGDRVLVADHKPVTLQLGGLKTRWLVFLHTTDHRDIPQNKDGFNTPVRGLVHLNVPVGTYVLQYADGTEVRELIRERHQIGLVSFPWGEGAFKSHIASHSAPGSWVNWIWAWQNPHPKKAIKSFRVEPTGWPIIISAITAADVESEPLRWETRRKAILKLKDGLTGEPAKNGKGLLDIDMGQVISVLRRPSYPDADWANTFNNQLPAVLNHELLVEYAAHPDARFHFPDGTVLPVREVVSASSNESLVAIRSATQRIRLRVVDSVTRKPVAVKLHIHGESGEYLTPENRSRVLENSWGRDEAPEFRYYNLHACTYIDGDTMVMLPLGNVYIEVSKGFEIQPIRKKIRVNHGTKTITLAIRTVLPWRDRGWVTADTHVHFLPPSTALLEGAAEGVNVINLLASQWTELMTNVGDFDGKTTLGEGTEFLVRVGTENRQPTLGHISLLGYEGPMITPLCSGGPEEAAQGDPVGVLLSEWARQCKKQKGLVVMPHFPTPRCEQAVLIPQGLADAAELCNGDPWGGISAYSLSDWYRYLNCGWFVPAVAGTDKMSPYVPVGAIRTYAKLEKDSPFTYTNWMAAVRAGNTFASFGPLVEFSVEGHVPGQPLKLTRTGGRVSVGWNLASVTIPMTRVELVSGGEILESQSITGGQASGEWTVSIKKSTWLALLVRGQYPGRDEVIAAHTSPVMITLAGVPYRAAADALTILEQIEGAIAYLDTVGTRATQVRYKKMRLILTSAHRRVHTVMHRMGHYHHHTVATDHPGHH